MHFTLSAITRKAKKLEIRQVTATAEKDRHDMVDLQTRIFDGACGAVAALLSEQQGDFGSGDSTPVIFFSGSSISFGCTADVNRAFRITKAPGFNGLASFFWVVFTSFSIIVFDPIWVSCAEFFSVLLFFFWVPKTPEALMFSLFLRMLDVTFFASFVFLFGAALWVFGSIVPFILSRFFRMRFQPRIRLSNAFLFVARIVRESFREVVSVLFLATSDTRADFDVAFGNMPFAARNTSEISKAFRGYGFLLGNDIHRGILCAGVV